MQKQTNMPNRIAPNVDQAEIYTQQLAVRRESSNEVIYSEMDPKFSSMDLIEEFQKNLLALEDAVGRLKVTTRDVRFHMKVE